MVYWVPSGAGSPAFSLSAGGGTIIYVSGSPAGTSTLFLEVEYRKYGTSDYYLVGIYGS